MQCTESDREVGWFQHLEPGYQCRWKRAKCQICGFSWGKPRQKECEKADEKWARPNKAQAGGCCSCLSRAHAPGGDKAMEGRKLGPPEPTALSDSPHLLNSPEEAARIVSHSFSWSSAGSIAWLLSYPASLSSLLVSSGSLALQKHLHLNHWPWICLWEERVLSGYLGSHALGAFDWQLLLHS